MDIFSQHIYNHPFLILFFSFIIGQCFMPVVLKVARARHFVVKPNKRMSHTGEVPNIGGIDIFMSFILTYLLFEYNQLHYSQFIFIGVFLILMTGFIDDLIDLSPSWKLAGECISGLFLIVLANIRLTHLHGIWGIDTIPDWVSYPLSFFVFIAIVNSLNLIDGVDGLASGLGMLYSLFFALYFQHIGEIHLATLSYCLIGSLAVFFIYNVFGRTHHKIFMGDSGSLLLGYMITLFVFRFCELNTTLTGVSHIPSAPAFMMGLLAIPLFDTVRVMLTRIKQKKSPFSADKNHMHHLLLKMGLSHVQVTLVLLIISLGSLTLSLLLRHLANGYLIMILLLYCSTFTFIVWRILDWKNRKQISSNV